MKKIIALLLALSITFTIVSCGNSSSNTKTSNNSNELTKDNKAQIKGEITVACYDVEGYKSYLVEAAKLFEKKHPGTKINFDGFTVLPEEGDSKRAMGAVQMDVLGEPAATKKADYINKINTELMSGKGADIIASDIIPYYKYADSGMLEDISKYINDPSYFKKSEYRENILDACKYKGEQYMLPIDYGFSLFSYDTDFFDKEKQNDLGSKNAFTYNKLIEIGSKSFEEKKEENLRIFDFFGDKDVFLDLFKVNYDKYVDIANKKANFNDGSFAQLLNYSKEVVSKGYIKKDINFDPKKDDMEAVSKSFMDAKYIYNRVQYYDIFRFFDTRIFDSNIMAVGQQISKSSKIGAVIESDSGKKSAEILHGVVMNANSKNKQTAWEFMKFLESQEMQMSMSLYGLPVNKKADEEKAKLLVSNNLGNPNMDQSTTELTKEQTIVYDKYMKTLNELSNSLNNVTITDSLLQQMVKTEVKSFFDGSKTADEVAKSVQTKVELYLNE